MELPILLFSLVVTQIVGVTCFTLRDGGTVEIKDDHGPDNGECQWLDDGNQQSESCSAYWADGKPPVVVISLDGFRAEYLRRKGFDGTGLAAPTINCLGQTGVRTAFMMPSFPTITFPNHYTMVTGLFPESHGIIHNEFYDPDLKTKFNIRSPDMPDAKWWRSGEPIWATAKRQGRISAAFFWPGSDVRNDQHAPNYLVKYNRSIPLEKRIDQVLDWLDLPAKERPDVVAMYFEDPDSTGHKTGPDSPNVTEKVTIVDAQIRRLVDGLKQNNRLGCVNLMVVSDHGMNESPPGKRLVDLAKYVDDLDKTSMMFFGPVTSIRPNMETPDEMERIRKGLECKDRHARVWTKWELPYRLHSSRSNRIPNLILDMDLGWRAIFREESYQVEGDHGWDNLHAEMHAIFAARGPSFKRRFAASPFQNIQLYNLMCALIDVEPADNNGTWGALHHLLVSAPRADLISAEPYKASPSNERIHAPLGVPQAVGRREMRVIARQDGVVGFNSRGSPEWTAYTLGDARSSIRETVDRAVSTANEEVDERFHRSAAEEEIHLFPTEVAHGSVSRLIGTMTRLLKETHRRFKRRINVITGKTKLDYPALFYIVSTCLSGRDGDLIDCPVKDREVQAFLLPIQRNYGGNCIRTRKYIAYHVATLQDVEHVTGLRFFPRLPVDEKLQMLSWTTLQSRLVIDPADW